jgi:hypothetical protein
MSAVAMLSDEDRLGAGRERLIDLIERLRFDLDRQPGRCARALATAAVTPPAEANVVVLDEDRVEEADAMVRRPAGADRVLFEHSQRRGRLARVEDRDAPAGRVDEPARARGDPESRCRKLSAVRSATSRARADPRTTAISSPAAHESPSRLCASTRTPGSIRRNASKATSSPASTQSALTRNTPRACCEDGTVASVVRSPSRTSSSSARFTMSR